jgi:hypothetical protein
MATEDTGSDSWRAPYMSYATLTNFIDAKISAGAVPPKIDSGFLDNYAGSVRPLIISTLKTIGMIGEDNAVQDGLREAVRSPESRKAVLRSWAETFYAEQIGLAKQNATATMLWQSFTKHQINGSTMRRAVIFYLGLSEDLELPVSAYFKPPKAAPSETKKRPPKGDQKVQQAHTRTDGRNDSPAAFAPETAGTERRVIQLGNAGTVEVTVKVRWLDLPDDTFAKLRTLIKDIEALTESGEVRDEEDAEDA